MTIYWVDGVNGDDGNNGLTEETAFATLSKAPTVVAVGDTVKVKDALYRETLVLSNNSLQCSFIGVGDSVWIDGEGVRATGITANQNFKVWTLLVENFKIKNVLSQGIIINVYSPGALPTGFDYRVILRNILVTHDTPASRVGTGIYNANNDDNVLMLNCMAERVGTAQRYIIARNCLFRDYTSVGTFRSQDFCGYPGATGGGNVNTTTYAPPYRDEPNWDYSLDPAGTNAAQFIAAGWGGNNIGMQSSQQRTYTSHSKRTGFNSGDSIFGDWINDTYCYDPSFPSTTIGGSNDEIWFDEGGAEIVATIANTTYTDAPTFVAAVDAAMDASAGADTYTTAWVDGHVTVTKDGGGTFNLRCNTGTNTNPVWEDIGFSTLADRNGATDYTSDYAMTVGPGVNFIVTISAARGNNKLDFDEGGGELTATIADTSTSTLSTVAAAVKTALDAAGAATYTITYDGDGKYSRKLKVTSSGGTLTLKTNDGTNAASSAWEMLGWDEVANKSGATSYLADYQTTSTVWELDADRRPTLSLDYEVDGRMAQGRSPLQDIGPTNIVRNIEWRGTEDAGSNRVFNADDAVATAGTRTAELRGDSATYTQGGADSGLDHNFTKFDKFDEINWGSQHIQARWTLRAVKR